jgi:hypothetical protein
MDPAFGQTLISFLREAGLLGAALLLIVALYTERLYLPGYVKRLEAQNQELRGQLKEMTTDRDDWRHIAHSQAEASERAVSVISRRNRIER